MLHRLDHFRDIPPECQGGIVSIGNFDGVHLGHLQLVKCMRGMARREGVPAVAFTFDPHPVSLLRPEQSPEPLTWTERKVKLLQSHGVDEVVVLHTTLEFLRLSADEFFAQVIRSSLRALGLVEGPNFGFGRGRGGSVATLNRLCPAAGVQLETVDPLLLDGQAVSSSRIRQCLAAGRVDLALRLLGRPHRVRGRVGTGAARGAGLGFPTANLDGCDTFLPADGVYACRAVAASRTWPVAAHIGPNATFGEVQRKLEAHLIGFGGDLRGQMLEVDFVARLRGTQAFASAAELVEQMRRDCAEAERIAGERQ